MKRISGFQKTENTKDGANPTLVNDFIDNTAYDIIKRVYDELPQIQEYFPNMAELREILAQTANNAQKAYQWAENPPNDEVEPGNYSAKHWAILAQDRVNEIHNLSISVSLVDPTYPATSTYDSSTGTLKISIPKGVGIQSISRISGENLPGTKDTYQITYTDNSTSTFEVYNGQDGVSITDIIKVNGDSSPGSIDTYRINKSDGTYSSINVYNGKDGVSVLSFNKLSGTGEPGTDDVYRLTLSDGSYTDITIHQGRDTTGDMEKSVYDTNNDGIVDKAEDALKLNGQTGDYYGKQSDVDTLNTAVNTLSTNKEDKSNKVTTFQPTPDNEHYPSEKLVKDQLDAKSDKGHTHTEADITDLDKYTKSEVDSKLATKANTTDVYTQTEIDDKLALKANASSIYSRATIDDKLATKIDLTEKGSANGVATLDENAKVPASQLPSFVDDVLEVDTLPSTGETGKLYVLTTTNQVFRWSGSSFIEISVGTGTADAAVKLSTPRNITISGDATGSTSFDGTNDVAISLTVSNSDKLDGMQPSELPVSDATQTSLDNKANKTLDNVTDGAVLSKVKAVDGTGSGLDADLLDGKELSEIETDNLVMTKAEFEALAENRRKMFAGSGFVEWGGERPDHISINEGMFVYRYNDPIKRGLWLGNTNNKPTIFNINGILVYDSGRMGAIGWEYGEINFPEPPTSVAHITDSTNLPVSMRQGDFAILDDTNRELVTNGTFDNGIDGWHSNSITTIESVNGQLKVTATRTDDVTSSVYFWTKIKVVKKGKYKIAFDVTGIQIGDTSNPNTFYLTIRKDAYNTSFVYEQKNLNVGHYEFEFEVDGNYNGEISVGFAKYLYINETSSITIDNVSVKQVEEFPIVAFQDVSAGTDIYANVDKFEARDSISRQDLVFLESWYEKIADKDVVYPFGNTQYRGGDVDGLTGIIDANWFTGYDTYSLFGNWQNVGELVGKGYRWSQLSDSQKRKLASNPENNIFIDENGNWIQFRYRVRVVKGLGNKWEHIDPLIGGNAYNGPLQYSYKYCQVRIKGSSVLIQYDLDKWNGNAFLPSAGGYLQPFYNGAFMDRHKNVFALPIALVQRRNQGAYHPVYNPEGSAKFLNADGTTAAYWYETDRTVTSLADCFAYATGGSISSGISGRPDGLYADEVNERDVEDLRMDAKVCPYEEARNKWLNKAIAGEVRGKEKTPFIVNGSDLLNSANWKRWFDDIDYPSYRGDRTYAYNNTLTHCDIIGDPRKLDDRVKYIVDTSVSQTVDIQKGDYVKVTSDGGSTYTYYVSLAARAGIDLSTDDYANTTNWANLGTDGNQGGYSQEWLDKGIVGTPLIVGEDGESLLPIDVPLSGNYQKYKVSKKKKDGYALKVIVSDKNGKFVEYSKYGDENSDSLVYDYHNQTNSYYLNITNTYMTLGYSSQEEMLALMKVLVFYETKADFLELADRVANISVSNNVVVANKENVPFVTQALLNKIPTGSWSINTKGIMLSNYTGCNGSDYICYEAMHTPIIFNEITPSNPCVKFFYSLTQQNNRAYLQFVFKELKYDETSGTWGDDNKFQIANKVSTRTDLNGQTVLYGQKRLPLNIFIKED